MQDMNFESSASIQKHGCINKDSVDSKFILETRNTSVEFVLHPSEYEQFVTRIFAAEDKVDSGVLWKL